MEDWLPRSILPRPRNGPATAPQRPRNGLFVSSAFKYSRAELHLVQMPAKKRKLKTTFKVFLADNHSRIASRFPFLQEQQIKAKLHRAWRKTFDFETTRDKKDIVCKDIHPKEKLPNEDRTNTPGGFERNGADYSPLRTYTERPHSRKRKPQGNQTITSQESQSSSTYSACGLATGLHAENSSMDNARKNSKQNELIDLFEVMSAEELLIEPMEMYQEDTSPFNPEKWPAKLEQNVQEEKDPSTVSGMFKWRADGTKQIQRKDEEKSCESRILVSNKCEGDGNFVRMFDGEEAIFL